jgi:hypothetical protein
VDDEGLPVTRALGHGALEPPSADPNDPATRAGRACEHRSLTGGRVGVIEEDTVEVRTRIGTLRSQNRTEGLTRRVGEFVEQASTPGVGEPPSRAPYRFGDGQTLAWLPQSSVGHFLPRCLSAETRRDLLCAYHARRGRRGENERQTAGRL